MKKGLFSIIVFVLGCVVFSSCIKNGTDHTIAPVMTTIFGLDTFKADYIEPSTINNQTHDTMTTLTITGTQNRNGDRIVLVIKKYKDSVGNFSIAAGQASATFFHNRSLISTATSGIVAIKEISVNTITGYFSFTTPDGFNAVNGNYVVGKPWDY